MQSQIKVKEPLNIYKEHTGGGNTIEDGICSMIEISQSRLVQSERQLYELLPPKHLVFTKITLRGPLSSG